MCSAAVADLKIGYPVAVDNDYAIWRAFDNEYWPAHYFIDAQGRMRYHHFGEGDYDESERVIQHLLAEAGDKSFAPGLVSVQRLRRGSRAEHDRSAIAGDLYRLFARRKFRLAGRRCQRPEHVYAAETLKLDQWSLGGDWTVSAENATLNKEGGRIAYRFRARDLHLVLGPAADGKRIRFRVTIDGAAPGRRSRRRHRRGRPRCRRRASALSAHPRNRRHFGSYLRDRVSRSRRAGLRFHVRLKPPVTFRGG